MLRCKTSSFGLLAMFSLYAECLELYSQFKLKRHFITNLKVCTIFYNVIFHFKSESTIFYDGVCAFSCYGGLNSEATIKAFLLFVALF